MPKAKRLPSGNYRTQVYAGKDENGKPRYESFTAPTARESELLAAQFKADLNRKKQTDRTASEAIDGYISAKEAVLSPSTIKAYKSQAKIRYDSIRNKSIRKLTSEDLQLFSCCKLLKKYHTKDLRVPRVSHSKNSGKSQK